MTYFEKIVVIQKFLSFQLNPTEIEAFETWISESTENKILFDQISDLWERSAQVEHPKFDAKKAFEKHKQLLQTENTNQPILPVIIPKSKNYKLLALLAILSILLITLFILNWNSQKEQVIETEETLIYATLDDGTDVWLAKSSKLTLTNFDNQNRKVSLTGKAYFNVKENKQSPFTIKTDGIDIRVIGTKFIVDTYNHKVQVREGEVEVSEDKIKSKVILGKNQSISLNAGQFTEVKDEIFGPDLLWFNEELVFNNTPFDIVVKDISTSFNVNIELPGTRDWTNCTFTSGSLKNNTFIQILNTLQLTYELKYEKLDETNYRFTSVKCK